MTDDHRWAQRHLSDYVDGELSSRGRRRLDRHALGCADCGDGIRAMRALVYAVHGLGRAAGVRAPDTIFDRVRLAGAAGQGAAGQGAAGQGWADPG
jgi:anti-sigma factor RsiW